MSEKKKREETSTIEMMTILAVALATLATVALEVFGATQPKPKKRAHLKLVPRKGRK